MFELDGVLVNRTANEYVMNKLISSIELNLNSPII
jgi:hypothetical protein